MAAASEPPAQPPPCPECGYRNPAAAATCSLCGKQLAPPVAPPAAGRPVDPGLAALRDKIRAEDESWQRMYREYHRAWFRGLLLSGPILFFVINFLSLLPFSLMPDYILFNALASVFFGLPTVYLIFLAGGGRYRGLLVGWLAFILMRVLLQVLATWSLANLREAAFVGVILGVFFGAGPGMLLGYHVEISRE